MKFKKLLSVAAIAGVLASLAAYASIPLGGSIFPLIYISQSPTNLTDAFNEMEALINQQVVGISTLYTGAASIPTSGVDASPVIFSTNIQQNPLLQFNHTDTLVSTSLTSAAYTTLIASEASRAIDPMTIWMMVSGTAATATALAVECSGGTLLASWPIAELVNLVPAGTYMSTAGPTLGAAFGTGCPAGQAIYLSNVGTNVTTTTHVYTNISYTVQ